MKVLLVEDNKGLSDLYGLLLINKGHHVTVINSLTQTKFAGIHIGDYDMVVAEYVMPGDGWGNGLELLRHLQDEYNMRTVLMSSIPLEYSVDKSIPVIMKPVDIVEIVETIL